MKKSALHSSLPYPATLKFFPTPSFVTMFPETFQGRVDADAPFRAERSLTGSHTMSSETLPGWRLLQETL